MKDLAADHYKSRRGNCAQSVALAWRDKIDPTSPHTDSFHSHGGGRAPEGLCGALHAAREISGEHRDSLTEKFKQRADGHITCRGIRQNRVMPCPDCVALAAELLEEHSS